MTGYILRRLLGAAIVMWAVATLVFFMLRIVPGDPLAAMLFEVGDPAAAEELRIKFGLDRPMIVQYAKWLLLIVQGDLGNSIYGSRIPVSQLLIEAAPRTISLAFLAFCVAVAIAIPAGLISAIRRGRPIDHGVTFIAFLGLAMPDFWLGILLIILFAANLGWLPAIGYEPLSAGFWPWFSHLILPATAAGTAFSAIIARMVRSSMLEVLKTDYVRVAQAKGLSPWRVVMGHAFPNALIPVITVMGIAFGLLMASAVVVETVFAIKGLGRILIEGILNRDYPVVQGAILVVSFIFVFVNLLVDVLYVVIDPRIRVN
ncbi:MAG: ABC transporter permease [Alphaproteobacteria bacterium]